MPLQTPAFDANLGTSTGATFTLADDAAAGTLVVISMQWFDSADPFELLSASDDGEGLAWVVVGQTSDTGNTLAMIAAYAPDGLASGTVVSLGFTSGGSADFAEGMVGSSFTGFDSVTIEDWTPEVGFETAWENPGVTVAEEKALVFATAGHYFFDNTGVTHSAASPYTECADFDYDSGKKKLASVYLAAEGADDYTPGGTFSTLADYRSLAVAFTPAEEASGTLRELLGSGVSLSAGAAVTVRPLFLIGAGVTRSSGRARLKVGVEEARALWSRIKIGLGIGV